MCCAIPMAKRSFRSPESVSREFIKRRGFGCAFFILLPPSVAARGEERRAKRVSRSSGPAKATDAAAARFSASRGRAGEVAPAARPSSRRSSLEMVHWTISFASQTAPHPRCDTFPLQRLRREGEGSCRKRMVAPRRAALELILQQSHCPQRIDHRQARGAHGRQNPAQHSDSQRPAEADAHKRGRHRQVEKDLAKGIALAIE